MICVPFSISVVVVAFWGGVFEIGVGPMAQAYKYVFAPDGVNLN